MQLFETKCFKRKWKTNNKSTMEIDVLAMLFVSCMNTCIFLMIVFSKITQKSKKQKQKAKKSAKILAAHAMWRSRWCFVGSGGFFNVIFRLSLESQKEHQTENQTTPESTREHQTALESTRKRQTTPDSTRESQMDPSMSFSASLWFVQPHWPNRLRSKCLWRQPPSSYSFDVFNDF